MIKRVIYIGNPCYINTESEQLIINNKATGDISSMPIEDIGIIELDNPQITITSNCLNKLSANSVIIVLCNQTHHPAGYFLPLEGNVVQTQRIKSQVEAKIPMKKMLWQQIVIAKISNQYSLLKKNNLECETLKAKIDKVKSGDSSNQEGAASQFYWKHIFSNKQFKRERFGDYPNNLLNYGYSILRAITARAIVSSGFHPSIGIHHKSQYNAFCLADDLMEPYRPYVDELVLKLYTENTELKELSKEVKKELLNINFLDVKINKKTHPLMLGVQTTCSSLTKCLSNETKKLLLPKL